MLSGPASPVRVFIAEDSALVRQRVAAALNDAAIEVVGEAVSATDSVRLILDLRPNVVVLDHALESGTGLDVMHGVRAVDPRVAYVVFSNNALSAYRKRYLAEGASDFLDKATDLNLLVPAVQAAAARARR